MDRKTKQRLFVNKAVEDVLDDSNAFSMSLRQWLYENTYDAKETDVRRDMELTLPDDGHNRVFSVTSYPFVWRHKNALAYVLTDISLEKEHVLKLENYAYTDVLTHLHNRYYGMQKLHEFLDEKRHFCLCFVDLDNLKFVNDHYGHSEGDNYIIGVGNLLKEFSRRAVVCRLGGDEFMLLIPDFAEEMAVQRMEELRSILIYDKNEDGPAYEKSVSYGVVEVHRGERASDEASALLSEADEKMYRYKRKQKAQRQAT